jgi:hypothetical protein
MNVYDRYVDALGSTVELIPPDKIEFKVKDVRTKVRVQFGISSSAFGDMAGEGYLDIGFEKTNLNVRVGATDDGKPYLRIDSSEIKFSSLDLNITGMMVGEVITWLVDIVRDVALENVENAISSAIVN